MKDLFCKLMMLTVMAQMFESCSSSHSVSDESTAALPLGAYHISGPLCLSTGEKPNFSAPELALSLLNFEGLTSQSIVISETQAISTFADQDCSLTLTRKIFANTKDIFSTTLERVYSFAPDGCSLTIAGGEQTAEVSASQSAFFNPVAGSNEEMPFHVEAVKLGGKNSGVYRLASFGSDPLIGLWSRFGCGSPDSLAFIYTAK